MPNLQYARAAVYTWAIFARLEKNYYRRIYVSYNQLARIMRDAQAEQYKAIIVSKYKGKHTYVCFIVKVLVVAFC